MPYKPNNIREKHHRLPKEHYRGEVIVAFTCCVNNGFPLFSDFQIYKLFLDDLIVTTKKNHCIVPIYCFMPEHIHLIIQGLVIQADTWRAMVDFKQKTGFWLSKNYPSITWQKDFYDHIIRVDEDLGTQIRYIANNPVRRGLTKDWQDYPCTGAIGIELNVVIEDVKSM